VGNEKPQDPRENARNLGIDGIHNTTQRVIHQGFWLSGAGYRRQILVAPGPFSQARNHIIDQYFADLEAVLASDRLASYRSSSADNLITIATYFWNIALSRDLYLSLGATEVSIRNGIHRALSAYAGAANWYDHIPLLPREADAVARAKDEIRKSAKPIIPGRVVAAFPFGFWTNILSKGFGQNGYGAVIWSPNNGALIRYALPHLQAPNQNRSYVHNRLNVLRLLRNRTMHHEPIFNGMTVRMQNRTTTYALADLYDDIVDSIGWTSPRLRDSIVAFDRFPNTLANGIPTQIAEIEAFLGL
jgi:hypothetical protein